MKHIYNQIHIQKHFCVHFHQYVNNKLNQNQIQKVNNPYNMIDETPNIMQNIYMKSNSNVRSHIVNIYDEFEQNKNLNDYNANDFHDNISINTTINDETFYVSMIFIKLLQKMQRLALLQ